MHYNCLWLTKPLYLCNLQIDTISNIEVIRQNVFRHSRVMVIGVSCDLNKVLNRASYSFIFPQIFFHIRIFIYAYFVDLKCFISISEIKNCNLFK